MCCILTMRGCGLRGMRSVRCRSVGADASFWANPELSYPGRCTEQGGTGGDAYIRRFNVHCVSKRKEIIFVGRLGVPLHAE